MAFKIRRDVPVPAGRNIGEHLNQRWKIGAKHSLYREDGRWYHYLTRFPGALCDAKGYVLFETEDNYRNCSSLKFGVKVNVTGGISRLPGYVRVDPEERYLGGEELDEP